MKLNKEKTILAILSKRTPFCNINESKLRAAAKRSDGVNFLKECCKFVRAQPIYINNKTVQK